MERIFEINEFVKTVEEKMYSKIMVTQLINEEVNSYERGRIKGQIEMLNTLKGELLKNEDSDIEKAEGNERSTRTDNRVSL